MVQLLSLSGVALVLVAGCSPCGTVNPTTWEGTLAYAFKSGGGDAGAGADGGDGGRTAFGAVIGSSNATVALANFEPWVQSDTGYCGANEFTVGLGPLCQLSATVDYADYGTNQSDTGSATIAGDQHCTLATPSGSFMVTVQGGTVGVSGSVLDLVVDTVGANLEFQGNLQ